MSGYDRQSIFRQAESLRARRKLKKALKEYQRILEVDSNDSQVLKRVGDIYLSQKNHRDAAEVFDRLVTAYLNDGRWDKAFPILKLLVELKPKDIERYLDLGELYVSKNRHGDAKKLYLQGLDFFKGRKHRLKRADLLQSILTIDSESNRHRLELAKIYRIIDEPYRARSTLFEGLRISAADPAYKKYRRKYYWQLFKLEPSWTHFKNCFFLPKNHSSA